jgi:hypothetical protein
MAFPNKFHPATWSSYRWRTLEGQGRLCAYFCAIALASTAYSRPSQAAVDRPPQFVAIAFDNCTELERWKELEQFLSAANAGQNRVHFTFFISGTNFLSEQAKDRYRAPGQRRGHANIEFGGSPDNVKERIGYINRLHDAGNDIGSHAVGHFYGGDTACEKGQALGKSCGANWSLTEWADEFDSYETLFANIKSNNGITDGFRFPSSEIVGFRAPQLSTNPGLYEALQNFAFRYDTSWPDGEDIDAWPTRNERGMWLFKLARLEISGLGTPQHPVTNLSMDYNICASQLRAAGVDDCETPLSDADAIQRLGDQMKETYMNYFKHNYMGNRAPLHIGHHFFGYQNGIYDKVLLEFAKAICSLPEVRCVSYRELADFMDKQDAATLSAYQRGDFDRTGLQEPAIGAAGR